jgi:hypothetical protein
VGNPRARLRDELEQFVMGRLVLILLPVQRELCGNKQDRLARLVGTAVQDIGWNVDRILNTYEVAQKARRC